MLYLNSLPASDDLSSADDFCFANSLDPDQAGQNIGPDLDLFCLTLMLFQNKYFENYLQRTKNSWKITHHAKS